MENIFLLILIMSETNLPNFVTTFVKSLHHALKLIFPISWKPQICQILSKKKGTVYPPDHVLDIPKSLLIPLSSQRLPRSRAHRRGTGATRASCHRTPRRWRRCGWTRRRATRSSPSPSRSSGRSPATSARTPSSAAAASAASTRRRRRLRRRRRRRRRAPARRRQGPRRRQQLPGPPRVAGQ